MRIEKIEVKGGRFSLGERILQALDRALLRGNPKDLWDHSIVLEAQMPFSEIFAGVSNEVVYEGRNNRFNELTGYPGIFIFKGPHPTVVVLYALPETVGCSQDKTKIGFDVNKIERLKRIQEEKITRYSRLEESMLDRLNNCSIINYLSPGDFGYEVNESSLKSGGILK